ncbi:hypothetical protein Tco_0542473 [Tanacetum coccineum]
MSPPPCPSQSSQCFSLINTLYLDEDEFDSLFSQPSQGPSQPVEETLLLRKLHPLNGKLEIQDQMRQEETELERLKLTEAGKFEEQRLAQKNKELELQEKIFAFQQDENFEKGIMYNNESHDHLIRRQLAAVLTLKQKIKELIM